jgi:hypothetical protein
VIGPTAYAVGAICCARRVEACEGDVPGLGSVAAGDGLRRDTPQRRMRCATGRTNPAGCVDGGRPDVRHSTSRSLRVWGRVATTQDGPEHRREETRAERDGHTARSYGTRKPHEWRRSRRPSGDRGVNRRGGSEPRGRNVPGEANPGDTDPAAQVAEGAQNPRRGSQDRRNGPDRR